MTIKAYYAFPKVPALLAPHHQIVYCHIRTLIEPEWGDYYPFAEKQPVYFTAPADWAMLKWVTIK